MSAPLTIGSLKRSGQRLAIYCRKCMTLSYIKPQETHFKDNVELAAMDNFYPCPNCDHCNSEGQKLVTISKEEH